MVKPHGPRRWIDEMVRAFQRFRHDQWLDTSFNDWIELIAIMLANVPFRMAKQLEHPLFLERERRYLEIAKRYKPEQLKEFARLFALLTMAMDEGCGEDVFGELLMKLDTPKRQSQVMTPWPIASMMAKMTLGPKAEIEKAMHPHGYLTINEPACGAGVMLLAAARHLTDEGINYQHCLHAVAVDTDLRCVHMTFIQATLIGLPAVVVHGNCLSLVEHSHWHTLFHITGQWDQKMKTARMFDAMRKLLADTEAEPAPEPVAAAPEEVEAPMPAPVILTPEQLWQPSVVGLIYPGQ